MPKSKKQKKTIHIWVWMPIFASLTLLVFFFLRLSTSKNDLPSVTAASPSPLTVAPVESWLTYKNTPYRYSFRYPPQLSLTDEHGAQAGENAPIINFSEKDGSPQKTFGRLMVIPKSSEKDLSNIRSHDIYTQNIESLILGSIGKVISIAETSVVRLNDEPVQGIPFQVYVTNDSENTQKIYLYSAKDFYYLLLVDVNQPWTSIMIDSLKVRK